jgi:hypothetical protein
VASFPLDGCLLRRSAAGVPIVDPSAACIAHGNQGGFNRPGQLPIVGLIHPGTALPSALRRQADRVVGERQRDFIDGKLRERNLLRVDVVAGEGKTLPAINAEGAFYPRSSR